MFTFLKHVHRPLLCCSKMSIDDHNKWYCIYNVMANTCLGFICVSMLIMDNESKIKTRILISLYQLKMQIAHACSFHDYEDRWTFYSTQWSAGCRKLIFPYYTSLKKWFWMEHFFSVLFKAMPKKYMHYLHKCVKSTFNFIISCESIKCVSSQNLKQLMLV